MRGFESNRLYDFVDGCLRGAGWVIRLCFVLGSCFLTLKCGPVTSRSYKISGEVETEIGNGRTAEQNLADAWQGETLRDEMYRTVYAHRGSFGSPHLVYDETPFGNYLELEGPKRWIDQTARQLGYDRNDFITLGYPTLYSTRRKGSRRPANKWPPPVREA